MFVNPLSNADIPNVFCWSFQEQVNWYVILIEKIKILTRIARTKPAGWNLTNMLAKYYLHIACRLATTLMLLNSEYYEYFLWGAVEPSPLLLRPLLSSCRSRGWWWMMWGNRWNAWQGKPKCLQKTCLSAVLSNRNPHDMTRVRTRPAVVGSRRLTAWATARLKLELTEGLHLQHGTQYLQARGRASLNTGLFFFLVEPAAVLPYNERVSDLYRLHNIVHLCYLENVVGWISSWGGLDKSIQILAEKSVGSRQIWRSKKKIG
jgi:hypothetical protein